MNSLIDIHQHLLYGLDDGPHEKPEMERMLVTAGENHVKTIIATPHIAPGVVPFSTEAMNQRILEARQFCNDRHMALEVLPGSEMLYTLHSPRYLAQRRVPTLADTDKVLMEFPPDVGFTGIEEAVQTVLQNGYVPVLSHIERYPCLMRGPRRAVYLKQKYEVCFQVNQSAWRQNQSLFVRCTLRFLLKEGWVDYIASDAHGSDKRVCRMQEAYQRLAALVGTSYADQLTGNGMTVQEMLNR
jgi:protein-tyrosine phosphatase